MGSDLLAVRRVLDGANEEPAEGERQADSYLLRDRSAGERQGKGPADEHEASEACRNVDARRFHFGSLPR